MKRTSLSILAALITLALQMSYSAQSPATIEGIVRDAATQQPLAGVRISLASATPALANPLQPGPPPPEATTDSKGNFSIQTRDVGRLHVIPTRARYIDPPPGVWVQVSPGQRIENLELKMAGPAVVAGRILNAQGQPFGGGIGTVRLSRYSYGTEGKRELLDVPGISFQRPNDKGEFRFFDVPPGEYYLRAYGGNQVLGSNALTLYYPGVTDEAKATRIPVSAGEELQLPALSWPSPEPGVEVKLHLTGLSESSLVQVFLGDTMLGKPRDSVITFRVSPGHHDALVIGNDPRYRTLSHALLTLDIGNSPIEQEVVLKQAPHINGRLLLENEAGERSPAPSSIVCSLRSPTGWSDCTNSDSLPGTKELTLLGLAPDMYVLSAKAGDRNILAEGLNITGDTELEIVLATPGAIVQGVVRNAEGKTLPGAAVALVPDAPYRGAGPLYRNVIADPSGRYEIHGIAPGTYKLFAWPELQGAAYRNAEFMKEFEDRGKPVEIQKRDKKSVDLTAF